MSLSNSVQLIGRIGVEPKTHTFDSGKQKTTFTFATEDTFKTEKGEKVKETTWHDIELWNKEKLVASLKKGMRLAISGKIKNGSYEKENVKHKTSVIVVDEVKMLDGKKD